MWVVKDGYDEQGFHYWYAYHTGLQIQRGNYSTHAAAQHCCDALNGH